MRSSEYSSADTASPHVTEGSDYFALQPPLHLGPASTFLSPKKPSQLRVGANSVSSVNSDATFVEGPLPSHSSHFLSTDTLVEDVGATESPKPMRKLSSSKPMLSNRTASSFSLGSLKSTEPLKTEDPLARAPHSALDAHFPFNRKPVPTETSKMQLPQLKKQSTLPTLMSTPLSSYIENIKIEQAKRSFYQPVAEDMRDSIRSLATTISYRRAAEMANVITQASVSPLTHLPDILVIDIRPFADYARGHIKGSLNVCLPLTLLKRSNFNLQRCINSLPTYEKLIFQNYLHCNEVNHSQNITFDEPTKGRHGLPPIFVYDNSNVSSNIYHMCKKLIDCSCWEATSAPPIYLMDESFDFFSKEYPNLISCGKEEMIDISTLSINSLQSPAVPGNFSNLNQIDTSRIEKIQMPPQGRSKSVSALNSASTPNVCNFVLPHNLPQKKFNIRHNEEVFDNISEHSSVENLLSVSRVADEELARLPPWLTDAVTNDNRVRADFNKLEKSEKLRLNSVLTLGALDSFLTPDGTHESRPEISCGLDYGHKNRYKDIFLFNHSRVHLRSFEYDNATQLDCDYINASYLKPLPNIASFISSGKHMGELELEDMQFIATQGPLNETIGDFWKCIVDQKCLLIVSLTKEFENGIQKCSKYWVPGKYYSGRDALVVEAVKQELCGNFSVRSFEVSINGKAKHNVLQIHLDKWEDMSAHVDVKDLLSIVSLKQHVMSHASLKSEFPTLTHCSAGCGRTGVFCAVDSLISLLEFNDNNCDLPRDPVYEVVNNLRQQRILMVQTMRQYCLIYDALVHYVIHGKDNPDLCKLGIVTEFLEKV